MRKRSVEHEAMKSDILDGLQRTLDYHHRRLLALARRQWLKHFGGTERSDTCASVRIRASSTKPKARPVSTAGFISARSKLARAKSSKFHFPGFAH